jgi:soluble lytic murein transglycosylase-like protein
MKTLFTLLFSFLFISFSVAKTNKHYGTIKSQKLYESIEKYSDEYNVPKHIAYNIAYMETGYRGPNHNNYNPHRRSRCGAVGPMQIIPRYAKKLEKKVTNKILMYDIDKNVRISMKMLKIHYLKYRSWDKAVACYHKGNPKSNKYSRFVTTNYDYDRKWRRSKRIDYPKCDTTEIILASK